jgi:SagB-type dehydrogenase family enzyme
MSVKIANQDATAAWKYHNATKHSYASVRTNPHALDWQNKPLPFKIYPTLEVTRLPRDLPQSGVSALSAISTTSVPKLRKETIPKLADVAQLLYLSAGITRSKKYPGGEMFFRAAACTGALYEIELYVVCTDLPGLAAGVYHFGVAEFGLRQLRSGDFREVLSTASGNEASVKHAPLCIVCTGTFWRNAWKYQARTYRHFGWDNGTVLANVLAVSASLGLPSKVIAGFVDEKVNGLLDLDTKREVTFSLVPIGHVAKSAPRLRAETAKLDLPLVSPSRSEVDYPEMREVHKASELPSSKSVSAWRKRAITAKPRSVEGTLIELPRVNDDQFPADSIESVIARRGSTRNFAQSSITLAALSNALYCTTRGVRADFVTEGSHVNDLYLIVNAVEGLASGSYFYRSDAHTLQVLRRGNFRKLSGYLGLEQALSEDASFAVFFLADLGAIFAKLGTRGYRAAQLEAGILGGKLYLAAYAQQLGATGLTFYDDDVVRFFSPHAQGKSSIFLLAVGKPAKAHDKTTV